MTSAIGSASSAMAAAFARFERSAARVADPNGNSDFVHEVSEMAAAKHMLAANVTVARTADQMTGELFNIWA